MHQSEGFQLMIFTNGPSIISEGQVADEFHHFAIIRFPPLPLVGSAKASEALWWRGVLSSWLQSALSAVEGAVVENKASWLALHLFEADEKKS